MVFQDMVRTGARARSRTACKYHVLSDVRLWCLVAAVVVVLYIGACGYVYNLARERHRLIVQRNVLRQEFLLLRSHCEALRNPLRIQKHAKNYRMVLLTEPQAVASNTVTVAKRD